MGANNELDERPIHKVKISDFYVLKYEVTNIEYARFLNARKNTDSLNIWIDLGGHWRNERCRINKKNDYFFVEQGFESYPVNFVSWYGANAYAKWIGGRLPTEAEWELLAFLSTLSSNLNDRYLVYKDSILRGSAQVMSCDPLNGLYDLFGNMWEWCSDWYSADYYKVSSKKNPQGPEKGYQKVIRGGSWATNLKNIYPTNRRATRPENCSAVIGFRIVKNK